MNCLEFRRQLLIDPRTTEADFQNRFDAVCKVTSRRFAILTR